MITIYNDAQPCTQNGDVTSLLQLHEWHPTNAYNFLPLATTTQWSSPFDHSRKSTAIVLLFLRVFLLDSTMSSQIAARDSASIMHTSNERHRERREPSPLGRNQAPRGKRNTRHCWPNHVNLAEASSLDRPVNPWKSHVNAAVAVWWWLILWIFCLLSDPCACEERCAGVDWVFDGGVC